jgi:hypothetical protein
MGKTFDCAYWMDKKESNVTTENISAAVKRAAAALFYHMYKEIPIKRVDTHLLRIGGVCTLALFDCLEMHIQKWDVGKEKCSMSMSGKNFIVSQMEWQRLLSIASTLSTLQAMHFMTSQLTHFYQHFNIALITKCDPGSCLRQSDH